MKLTVLVSSPTKERLEQDSERTGRSVSWIVRELLAEGMREMPVEAIEAASSHARHKEARHAWDAAEPTLEVIE